MRFRQWLEVTGGKIKLGGTPTNQGFQRGTANAFGHTDNPGIVNQTATAALGAAGTSTRNSLEDERYGAGLKVQGQGRILPPPGMEAKPGIKYFYLPIQTPQIKHNGGIQNYSIKLETQSPVTGARVYREALAIDINKIRMASESTEDVNGKFILLRQQNDSEGKELWNWDPNEARQFTRALIYRCIVDQMNKSQRDRFDYDINSFEIADEREQDGVMTTWFAFDPVEEGKK